MENRITSLLNKKKQNILSIYFTAGYPALNDTASIITELEKCGVDLIEIGIPFSDPVADGPVIQRSSEIALRNGMSIQLLFEQLKEIRNHVSVPLILMGYINPVMQYGIEDFCFKCRETGIDGTIIPDMPLEVYEEEYKEAFEKNSLSNIFLITPQTIDERIRKIDSLSNGFIYMVSSSSTTGAKGTVDEEQIAYFSRIQNLNLRSPRLIGFGISDKATFERASAYANGAIIGSAFISAMKGLEPVKSKINLFMDKFH